jgi:hypothetical protein
MFRVIALISSQRESLIGRACPIAEGEEGNGGAALPWVDGSANFQVP